MDFFTRMPSSPSQSRSATLGPACSWLSITMLIHNIFMRAWMLAFCKESRLYSDDGIESARGESECFSAAVGRRLARVTKFLGDGVRRATCVTIGLVSKPLDDLMLTMLRLDGAGRVLADMLSSCGGSNPIRCAQRQLVELLSDGEVAKVVSSHFSMDDDAREVHMGTLRAVIVELSSAIYFRISLYLERYPFKLLELVLPEVSEQKRQAL